MKTQAFSSLALPEAQLTNLASLGYQQMTEIQAAALPLALDGQDLIAQAKTGSGKTVAFGLCLVQKLNPRDFGTQALVMCPTRELATQVAAELRRLARYQQNIKVVILCGGTPIGPQIGSLEHGAHIVVGTPGRVADHLRKATLSLERAETVVLDEADRMLDMGFVEAIEGILAHTPKQRQTLLFSATYPPDIASLSARFQRNPQRISVTAKHDEGAIEQHFYPCEEQERHKALLSLLAFYQPDAAVVFCNTRNDVAQVAEFLARSGVVARALHGDMEQRDRDQVLIQFAQQSCSVLVATDVAARGLDIDDLPAVINYQLPRDTQVYVHRIGRTGRAGKKGLALSLFASSEAFRLEAIAAQLDSAPSAETLPSTSGSGRMQRPAFVTLCIGGGRKDKIRPGDVLGALTGEAGIPGDAVGKITIADYAAYVAVQHDAADLALGRLLNGRIKGRKFKVRKL